MHKIGIIGGGQLGKMMILDAKRLDDYFVILDPTLHCPAHSIADEHIVADFDDVAAYGDRLQLPVPARRAARDPGCRVLAGTHQWVKPHRHESLRRVRAVQLHGPAGPAESGGIR